MSTIYDEYSDLKDAEYYDTYERAPAPVENVPATVLADPPALILNDVEPILADREPESDEDDDGEAEEEEDEDEEADTDDAPLPVPAPTLADPATPSVPYAPEPSAVYLRIDTPGVWNVINWAQEINHKYKVSVTAIDGQTMLPLNAGGLVIAFGISGKRASQIRAPKAEGEKAAKPGRKEADSTINMRALLLRGLATQAELDAVAEYKEGSHPGLTHFRRIMPAGYQLDITDGADEIVVGADGKKRIHTPKYYSYLPIAQAIAAE